MFCQLPQDILKEIITYLPHSDLSNIYGIDKDFMKFIGENYSYHNKVNWTILEPISTFIKSGKLYNENINNHLNVMRKINYDEIPKIFLESGFNKELHFITSVAPVSYVMGICVENTKIEAFLYYISQSFDEIPECEDKKGQLIQCKTLFSTIGLLDIFIDNSNIMNNVVLLYQNKIIKLDIAIKNIIAWDVELKVDFQIKEF
jgi:hypothetical protein